jgi:hypothetical protein
MVVNTMQKSDDDDDKASSKMYLYMFTFYFKVPKRLQNHVFLESFFTDMITNDKDDPCLSVPTRKVSIISFHLKTALQNRMQLFDPDCG